MSGLKFVYPDAVNRVSSASNATSCTTYTYEPATGGLASVSNKD